MAIINDFTPIWVGDTGAPFISHFSHQDGSLVNLTGSTISMKMEDSGGNIKICLGTWTIDDAINGLAHYSYASTDVDTPGVWTLFITITTGGKPLHCDEKLLEIRKAP
jgi:hypothetical protein